MNKEALQSVIAALREGRTPSLSVEDFPCFSHEATEGNQHVDPTYLDVVAKSLTADDAPTFERALRAMEEGDLAWLGFKIVYDADAAQRNTDHEARPTASRSCSSATMRKSASPRARIRRAISSK